MCVVLGRGGEMGLHGNVMLWVPNSASYFFFFLSPGTRVFALKIQNYVQTSIIMPL